VLFGEWLWRRRSVHRIEQVTDAEIEKLTGEYDEEYTVSESLRPGGNQRQALRGAARIELGLRIFSERNWLQCLHGYV